MKYLFLFCNLLVVFGLFGQNVHRWTRTYDREDLPEATSATCQLSDSTYRICVNNLEPSDGFMQVLSVDQYGDTLISGMIEDSTNFFLLGGTNSVINRPDDSWLWAGAVVPRTGGDAQGHVKCFDVNNNILWSLSVDTNLNNGFTSLCLTQDGGACLVGLIEDTGQGDAFVVRIDSNGDTLWTSSYGGGNGEIGNSIQETSDLGFVIGGYRRLNSLNTDTWVFKIDANGNMMWDELFGGPHRDNGGAVQELTNGDLIIATARALEQWPSPAKNAALILIDQFGNEQWTEIYFDSIPTSFRTAPIIIEGEGLVIAGEKRFYSDHGLLMKVDTVGQPIWERTFSTSQIANQEIRDLKATKGGGFIMTGVAYDSLLISKDAWLVKVDSFGCLVPGCQIFDGLEEQFTDLNQYLTLAPNPAHESTALDFQLPHDFQLNGPIELSLISVDGRLVHQEKLRDQLSILHRIDLSGLSSGVYFVHLRDGNRWLAGKKLVVQ